EKFSFEIVISQQFVDAPQAKLAKWRRKQVRVNVDELRGREHILDHRRNLRCGEKIAISGDWNLGRRFGKCGSHDWCRPLELLGIATLLGTRLACLRFESPGVTTVRDYKLLAGVSNCKN